jgi:hypothetical protein
VLHVEEEKEVIKPKAKSPAKKESPKAKAVPKGRSKSKAAPS